MRKYVWNNKGRQSVYRSHSTRNLQPWQHRKSRARGIRDSVPNSPSFVRFVYNFYHLFLFIFPLNQTAETTDECRRLDISDFLIKPFQRYPFLANDTTTQITVRIIQSNQVPSAVERKQNQFCFFSYFPPLPSSTITIFRICSSTPNRIILTTRTWLRLRSR